MRSAGKAPPFTLRGIVLNWTSGLKSDDNRAAGSIMTITISAELEAQMQEKAKAAGSTVEAYLERLIREDAVWTESMEAPLHAADAEHDEIRAAVSEGLAQAERGEGKPARDVFARLRARHGLPR